MSLVDYSSDGGDISDGEQRRKSANDKKKIKLPSIEDRLPTPKSRVQKSKKPVALFSVPRAKSKPALPKIDLIRPSQIAPVEKVVVQESVPTKDSSKIIEFRADEFYNENVKLNAQGEFVQPQKVHAISGGRHQITSLLRNAIQNKESQSR